jgi:NAD(P)-dependent dehydrogenase (short-subunit alcohol dehydrogenase family)
MNETRKIVLITGAAKRIGHIIALEMAKAGWDIAIHYGKSHEDAKKTVDLIKELGQNAICIQADLAIESEVQKIIPSCIEQIGVPDCIVNNASLFEQDSGLDFTTELAIEQLKVNLIAPLKLGQYLAQFHLQRSEMVKSSISWPSIVHVLDQKVFNLNPDYFSYTLSKLALERAVALQAQALAPGIRVNAVSPGLMYLSGDQTPENCAKSSKINLLQKAIDPKDVAKSCFFLASTNCLTGATIKVDCGQHLVPLARDVMFMIED